MIARALVGLVLALSANLSSGMGAKPLPPLWYCGDCHFKQAGNPKAVGDISDAIRFIKTEVNPTRTKGWQNGESLAVCDGTWCILIVYTASGNFLPASGTVVDPHLPYKNKDMPSKSMQPVSSDVAAAINTLADIFNVLSNTVTSINTGESFNITNFKDSPTSFGGISLGGYSVVDMSYGGPSSRCCVTGGVPVGGGAIIKKMNQ